jgi:hypothetical protein
MLIDDIKHLNEYNKGMNINTEVKMCLSKSHLYKELNININKINSKNRRYKKMLEEGEL